MLDVANEVKNFVKYCVGLDLVQFAEFYLKLQGQVVNIDDSEDVNRCLELLLQKLDKDGFTAKQIISLLWASDQERVLNLYEEECLRFEQEIRDGNERIDYINACIAEDYQN
ncbi:hypothetical protein K0504_09655 [Neiella marina]|uniref:Uncharacterized protein n=1 Tax=Neiella holothuriorum TaxID=2870530 RepID=A0ABS7EG32_9GAMM|nr:hypothetical protein [Neiella holothuriorum]MBW8191301.1 hypothetical protein [Neiella holothuriorum]